MRKFYKKEKGVDIDGVEFMDAPYDLEQYNFDNITGNINLMAGRIISLISAAISGLAVHFISGV